MKFAKKGLLLLSMTTIIGIGTSKNVWATESMPVGDFPNTNVTTEESTESTVSGLTIVEENSESTESTESTEIIEGTEQPEEIIEPVMVAKINRKSVQLKVGKTTTLSVSDYDGKVKWSSSKPEIAKVSKDGKITAKTPGETVIVAQAGEQQLKCKVCVVAQTKYLNKWVEKKGRAFYYNKYGVKVVGKKSINGKDYYFDKEGRQRVGWVKSKGNYYFYNIGKMAKGYQVTGKKINGIKLAKTGEAKLTKDTKKKVQYLTDANDICFDYVNFNMSKKDSLKKIYTLFAKGELISYRNYGGFKNSKNWDQHYASYYFEQGIGDCYTAGCAFAYMATALGYEDVYAVSSGGHGWCKIGDKHYDPNWGWWGASNMYDAFGSAGYAKGKAGSMNWKACCKYMKKIS